MKAPAGRRQHCHIVQARAELAAHGIDPNLLRLSVGTERVEDIIATLAEALG